MSPLTPFRFALREIRFRPIFAGLFAASVGAGTAGLIALAGVSGVVEKTIRAQAKELWAADITVKGSEPLLDDVQAWAAARWPGTVFARRVDTLSMAQHRPSRQTRQVTLSAVSAGYPLYGRISTASGKPFSDVLRPGTIVVADRLLGVWGINVGSSLRIGNLDLVIADSSTGRTDVPTSFFELSPTVFISLVDLAKSGLLSPGSRALNTLYLNLPPTVSHATALEEIKRRAASETTEVGGWMTDNPGLLKFLNNTLLYLDFLALLILTLGGIGSATALSAALAAGSRGLATLFALGAPRSYVLRAWLWWIFLLAGAGLLAALVIGRGLGNLLLTLFGGILPAGLLPAFPAGTLLQATLVGLGASVIFALAPLFKWSDLPPTALFSDRLPALPPRRLRTLTLAAGGTILFFLMAWAQIGRPWMALSYVAGLAAVLLLGGGLVAVVMGILRRVLLRFSSVAARLAGRGLARPGNLNDAVVFSLAVSLAVILTLFLLETNLQTNLIERFPVNAPNAFFVNVLPGQESGFSALVGKKDVRLFPLIRGRVVAVNDQPIKGIDNRALRRRGQGDRLTREFGFTFGDTLLSTDRVVEGPGLWDPALAGPQVSVFIDYKKRFGLRRGDQITISVLGRRLTATVASFRSINQSVRQPFFYFQFKPGLLDQVPHTLMGGLSLPKSELPNLQNRLAEAFPNITVIDLSDVAELTGRILGRLGRVVAALGYFGLSSGLLLLVAGLLASLASRTRDAAVFRLLGATRNQVVRIALFEYTVIGSAAALTAFVVGSSASVVLLRQAFDLSADLFPGATAALLGGSVLGTVLLSWGVTRSAFRAAPMEVLRHE